MPRRAGPRLPAVLPGRAHEQARSARLLPSHIVNERLWEDFKIFARAEVGSGDLDPIYPVLRRAYAAAKLDTERALWRSLLLLTWYHVGSAEKVWRAHP